MRRIRAGGIRALNRVMSAVDTTSTAASCAMRPVSPMPSDTASAPTHAAHARWELAELDSRATSADACASSRPRSSNVENRSARKAALAASRPRSSESSGGSSMPRDERSDVLGDERPEMEVVLLFAVVLLAASVVAQAVVTALAIGGWCMAASSRKASRQRGPSPACGEHGTRCSTARRYSSICAGRLRSSSSEPDRRMYARGNRGSGRSSPRSRCSVS